ncbi:hypothetical protein CBS101457_001879 [Exobasidium rhododendri]|nr:hypothetical protein CBS101457_001879 [Exobasidium rhododendri]
MSERYPLISQLIEENKIPEFDNLYLDMNGIIHNCSHPNDGDAHFRISEADMFLAIFSYIEHLFTKIKPQKLFFLAVDGVAPRAKMNQQRSRRFRTAKEAREIKMKAERRGEDLPEEDAFDSNCITPGTPFMARLSQQLKYFLAKKVTDDAQWQGIEIVLSSHEVPGEGEHKIMEYIRLAKAQPDYNPNVRHCLYGLDADLVMLGLLSHDPHFALLREEVNFGPSRKKKGGLESQNFFLLHLSLFREYLDLEFQELRSTITFGYSLERVIDDFILLNIFVGNDFLPHLPGMHINEGALNRLFEIYKRVIPKAGGYINEDGNLNTARLAMILSELSQFEREHFEEEFADATWYKGKEVKSKQKGGKASAKSKSRAALTMTSSQKLMFEKIKGLVQKQQSLHASAPQEMFLANTLNANDRSFLLTLGRDLGLDVNFDEYDPEEDAPAISISTASALGASEGEEEEDESKAAIQRVLTKYDKAKTAEVGDEDDDNGEDGVDEEEEFNQRLKVKMDQWKRTYYREKMGLDYDNEDDMKTLAFRYVEGLQWVLHYYYDGVASWGWFYDYHYSPMISDLKLVEDMKFDFQLGKPFRPFDQLMGVLPSLSSQHIPEAYRDLMTDPASSIIDFYPLEFAADLNGKKQDWEAIVKIPFIDEKRLLEALDKRQGRLTADEKARNGFGNSTKLSYEAGRDDNFTSPLPGVFPDIVHCKAKMENFHLPILDGLHLVKGLCDGAGLGVNALAGFPSVNTLPHYGRLGHHGVNVFQSESRNESIVISIENTYEDSKTEDVANNHIGRRTFISWPFLQEGIVTGVSDELFKYEAQFGKNGEQSIVKNPHHPGMVGEWKRKASKIEHFYSKRCGVLIGDVDILLHVRPLTGLKRMEDGSFLKDYEEDNRNEVEQAIQVSVPHVINEDGRYTERPPLPLPSEFPEKSKVFYLGEHAYGSPASIIAISQKQIAIQLISLGNLGKEVSMLRSIVANPKTERYFSSHQICKRLGVSGLALSKITSSMMIDMDGPRTNIGLNLKFEAKGQKVLGYSEKGAYGWEFSVKAIDLLQEYKTKFPEVFQTLMDRPRDDIREISQIFADQSTRRARMVDLKDWIKAKGVRDLEAVPLFAEQLSQGTVDEIEKCITQSTSRYTIRRVMLRGIPRSALLKPAHAPYKLTGQHFALGDRVVCVADTGMVPLATRGVVVGINSSNLDVVFDAPFLAGTTLDGRCSAYKGGVVGFASVLNLSQPQFTCTEGGASTDAAATTSGDTPTAPTTFTSALERTLLNGNGHGAPATSQRKGVSNGRGGGNAAAAAASSPSHPKTYRPPNALSSGASRGGSTTARPYGADFSVLKRGENGVGNGRKTDASVPFSHVTSGRARPAGNKQDTSNSINPHLAALSIGGDAGAGRGGSTAGRGGALRGGQRGGFTRSTTNGQ